MVDTSVPKQKLTCPWPLRYSVMARYNARKCPKSRDYFDVAVSHPTPQARDLPIVAYCAVCGHNLRGWRLIRGGKRAPETFHPRLRKMAR